MMRGVNFYVVVDAIQIVFQFSIFFRSFVTKAEVCCGDVSRSKVCALMPSFNIKSNVNIDIIYQHC